MHLLTGEYPPMHGGVSDHTAKIAEGLAQAGARVHVWAPVTPAAAPFVPDVSVHRVGPSWRRADLAHLGGCLDEFPRPRRLIVQYVPGAWGRRGLNFAFCRWLQARRRSGDHVSLIVHEPFYPWRLFDKPARWLLAMGQRWMIRDALGASARVYVAIPAWERLLRPYAGGNVAMKWLPVSSNIAVVEAPTRVAALRARLAPPDQVVVGTFGTYGSFIARLLGDILPALLLGKPDRVGVLIGRDGERLATQLAARHPVLADRLVAPGQLDAESVSLHLQACDVLIQPYPDGVSTRRGTIMAPLSHGAAIVTNAGFLSEPFWSQSGCVALADGPQPRAIVELAERVLQDAGARDRLGRAAHGAYQACFAVEHAVRRLLES